MPNEEDSSPYYRLQTLDVRGKRVLLRVDFNVPLETDSNQQKQVRDDTRLKAALETIRYLRQKEAKILLASHLGRPKGTENLDYSLEPVGQKLSELLRSDVIFSPTSIGDGPETLGQRMAPGEIVLLENLRFHPGETKNDPELCRSLAKLCDVYVNDAFGTLHRAHASTAGVAELAPAKGFGLLVQRELTYLRPLKENPKRPFALMMGGAKVSDKLGVLDQFIDKADTILIGGAMAYAFLKAKGNTIGDSLCDDQQVQLAKRILIAAQARETRLLLPIDHRITDDFKNTQGVSMTKGPDIPDGKMGIDIGDQTVQLYREALGGAETLFWNGPMGVFEVPEFAKGTRAIAEAASESSALKLAGGGDVAAALAQSGCSEKFDFISTGGGATLEYLEGKHLPGLRAMEIPKRERELDLERKKEEEDNEPTP